MQEPTLGIDLVLIPAGSFIMGDDENISTSTLHQVTISKAFWLSKCELTLQQWQHIMGMEELHPEKPNPFAKENHQYPAVSISYNDIQVFLQKLNDLSPNYQFRLPSEAEWEYACRAGTTSRYSFGDAIADTLANYNAQIPYEFSKSGENIGHPVKVGTYQANAFGLFDMHGNVWEWVNDWYAPYASDSICNPQGPETGTEKVIRGGSFYYGAANATSAHRRTHDPATWGFSIGFRLVCATKE